MFLKNSSIFSGNLIQIFLKIIEFIGKILVQFAKIIEFLQENLLFTKSNQNLRQELF